MHWGLYSYDIELDFSKFFSWLPIAVCILYLVATQKKSPLLAQIGLVLHLMFTLFVCYTYYLSLYCFVRAFGFVNKGLLYRWGSVILIGCIIFVLVRLVACLKEANAGKDESQ